MHYYEGPIDIYDADGNMLTGDVDALLELAEDGQWWGRLRSEAALPEGPASGMISLPDGKVGHVVFMREIGPEPAGADVTDVDFRGEGPAPFGPVDQEA